MPQNEEQITLGDLLSAHGELESIQTLLTDRSEVGTYAKVAALCEEHEALLAALQGMLDQPETPEAYDARIARAQAAIRKVTHG